MSKNISIELIKSTLINVISSIDNTEDRIFHSYREV